MSTTSACIGNCRESHQRLLPSLNNLGNKMGPMGSAWTQRIHPSRFDPSGMQVSASWDSQICSSVLNEESQSISVLQAERWHSLRRFDVGYLCWSVGRAEYVMGDSLKRLSIVDLDYSSSEVCLPMQKESWESTWNIGCGLHWHPSNQTELGSVFQRHTLGRNCQSHEGEDKQVDTRS